jgi:hypothetical protein
VMMNRSLVSCCLDRMAEVRVMEAAGIKVVMMEWIWARAVVSLMLPLAVTNWKWKR